MLEKDYGAPALPTILRRYEFYKFGGTYDPVDHSAILEGSDSSPLGSDLGAYIGAQNAAVNLNLVAAVAEPETYAMMIAGLGLLGAISRTRKRNPAAS